MPLGQANHVTAIQVAPPSFPDTPHSAVSGLAQTAPYGRRNRACIPLANGGASGVENDDKYEDERAYRYPAMHDDNMLAKSPPSRPFFSGAFPARVTRPSQQQTLTRTTRESRLAKFFSAAFRIPHPSRKDTLATFPCRYPKCSASVRSDEAVRLGGFCCETHMW